MSGLSEGKHWEPAFLAREGCDSSHPSVGVVGHGLIPRGKLSRPKHTQRGKGRGSGHQPSQLGWAPMSRALAEVRTGALRGSDTTPVTGRQGCDLGNASPPPGLPNTPQPPTLPTCGSKGPGGHLTWLGGAACLNDWLYVLFGPRALSKVSHCIRLSHRPTQADPSSHQPGLGTEYHHGLQPGPVTPLSHTTRSPPFLLPGGGSILRGKGGNGIRAPDREPPA